MRARLQAIFNQHKQGDFAWRLILINASFAETARSQATRTQGFSAGVAMRAILFVLLVVASFPPSFPPDGGMKPFTLDHRGGAASVIDLSFLLDAPAGKRGFPRLAGGHRVTVSGERERDW